MSKVTIYTSPTCHFCHLAKDFLDENKIEYTERDVLTDSTAAPELINKSGQMGVPVIDIDGEIVVGFDQAKLSALLNIN